MGAGLWPGQRRRLTRRAVRRPVRRATLRDPIISSLHGVGNGRFLPLGRNARAARGFRRLQDVHLLRLLGAQQADLHEVERADERVGDAEATGSSDGVAQRHGPVVLEQDQRCSGVVRDVLDDVPRVLVAEDLDAFRGCLGSRFRAGLESLLTLEAETDEGPDLAPDLDRLFLREVAQVLDLDEAVRVLVDRERVDDAHRVALTQPLELFDDLAVEVRLLEAQHEKLYGSYRHYRLRPVCSDRCGPRDAFTLPRGHRPANRPRWMIRCRRPVYWRAIATRRRSSGSMKWSLSSFRRLIWTQLILPVKRLVAAV